MGSIQKANVKSQGQGQSRVYKGLAPLYLDRILFWLLKTVFQIPIFIMFYIFFISKVNISDTLMDQIVEVAYIFVFLVVSDILAYIIASGLNKYLIHRWGYLTHNKNRRHFIAFLTEYIIYVGLRTLSYAIGLIWTLTRQFYFGLPMPWNDYAFLLAWILISLGSKFIAMLAGFIILS